MKFDIRYYLSIFFRRFHYFLIVAVLVGAAGVTIASVLPPVYRATATVLVEGQQIPGDLAASTVQSDANARIALIQQRLLARARILAIANDLKIYNRSGVNPDTVVSDMRRRININFRPRGGGNGIILISFRSSDPGQAAEVANQLSTIILNESVEARTGQASQTLSFFEEEAARLSAALDVQSQKILRFKLANKNALPENLDFRLSQQSALQERLTQLQRQEADQIERRNRLVDLYERSGRVELSAEALSPAERQLVGLQKELDNALLIYSDINPKVRVLQARISALQAEVDQERAADTGAAEEMSAYELQLAEIDSEIESLRERQKGLEDELERLRLSIEQTPINGIALEDLQREYANLQRQYGNVVNSQATAAMGERIELLSKGERYTLLEQAVPPPEPTSPNRPMIAGATLGGGIAGGLALVLLLELLNSSIRRPVEITSKLGITPIGTLPYIRTRREKLMRRLAMGVLFLVVGVGIPAAILYVHLTYLPIDILIRRALQMTGLAELLENF